MKNGILQPRNALEFPVRKFSSRQNVIYDGQLMLFSAV